MNGVTAALEMKSAGQQVAQGLAHQSATAKSAAAQTTANTSASAASQGITSNDFLTLLVTEMKNQDPTQPTDPNAYIQQLVGVNSLQQLISINQELAGATTTTGQSNSSQAKVNSY